MEEPALVDRQPEMARLRTALEDLHSRKGALLLLRGETGIGKSRLVDEAFRVAGERGYAAARGTSLTETMSVYFPWHEALRPLGLEHLLEETAAPSLLGLYLVTQAGLLVLKEERVSTTADAEIFSGMVTAVTEFMADALTKVGSTEGPVAAMRSGSRGIVMRRGSGFGLAAVVVGRESEGLLDDLRSLVDRIEESCGERLRSWNGSCTGMESTGDLMRDLVSSPKYAGSGPAAAEDPESRRALLFGNVVLGVQRLSERQPVLLVFEDLQWSDPSSLALLHYLARNTRRSAVLMLCNYRVEESGVRPHLAESLGKMRVEGLVDELTIPRLGPADARSLAESMLGRHELPAEFFAMVESKAAGNPLFIREVIRALEQEGAVADQHGVKVLGRPLERLSVPLQVRDVVAGRLHHLSEEERQVLEAAAVAGTVFRGSLVAAVMGEPEVKVLRTLGGIGRRHGLVRSEGDRLRFDHPLVREVLYDETIADLRRAYHLAAAESLERSGAEVVEVAEHLLSARDPRAVAKLLEAAAVAGEKFAHDEAARLFGQSLTVAPVAQHGDLWERRGDAYEAAARYELAVDAFTKAEAAEPTRSARCMRKRAVALERLSRYPEALDMAQKAVAASSGPEMAHALTVEALVQMRLSRYEDAAAAAEKALFSAGAAQDPMVSAAAMQVTGECCYLTGMHDDATRDFRRALELMEKANNRRGVARSWNGIGLALHARGDYKAALDAYHKALSIREAIGDRYGVAVSLNNIGTVKENLGELDAALDGYRRCLEIEESIGDLSGVAMALDNIGNVHTERGEFQRAFDHHQRSLAIREAIGDQDGMLTSLINMGGALHGMGEYRQAVAICGRCIGIASDLGDRSTLAMSHHNLGTVLGEMGDRDGALDALKEGLAIREKLGEKQGIASSLLGIARVLHAMGDTPGAMDHVSRGISILDEIGDRLGRIEPLSLLARMQLRLGRPEEAGKAAKEAVALARESGERGPMAGAMLASALCGSRSGQEKESLEAFREAAEIFDGMGSYGDLAQTHLDWGLAERQFGRESEARGHLERAAKLFEKCGLSERVEEVLSELSLVGQTASGAREGPGPG